MTTHAAPAKTSGTARPRQIPAHGTRPSVAPSGGAAVSPAPAATPPRGGASQPPAPPPTQHWDAPSPAANYLAGPGLLLSVAGGQSQLVGPSGTRLVPQFDVTGTVAAAASDLHGGVWYSAGNGGGTLLWTNGRQARAFSWRVDVAAGPAQEVNLTVAPDGSAWLLYVVPTAHGGAPSNLLGVGDAGGRAVAVHVSLAGGVQAYTLPPLVGAGVVGLSVGPSGQIWFCTTEPGGDVRALYAYDPVDGTAQPFNLPVLGRALQLAATPAGVWLRVQAAAGPTALLQVDPQSGAAAVVLRRVTGMTATPDGALLVAVYAGGSGDVYRIDTHGDRGVKPVLQIPYAITGLAASAADLWALAANRLYRVPNPAS